eukprot:TRINITY_DN5502_c1_g1_i3.p2 TRINITY_DN5502_c1_g1~~TRINITY_DN5502_c1_g1_i3.p2  ORF type:complete len:194 (-),score=-20.04 TRINITY_DN5502_c1_g1_i3:198-704(-)
MQNMYPQLLLYSILQCYIIQHCKIRSQLLLATIICLQIPLDITKNQINYNIQTIISTNCIKKLNFYQADIGINIIQYYQELVICIFRIVLKVFYVKKCSHFEPRISYMVTVNLILQLWNVWGEEHVMKHEEFLFQITMVININRQKFYVMSIKFLCLKQNFISSSGFI